MHDTTINVVNWLVTEVKIKNLVSASDLLPFLQAAKYFD